MATRTNVLARLNDPITPSIEGRVEVDWNDTNNRITTLRCVNPTSQAIWCRATPLIDPTVAFEKTYSANSGTTEDNVPGNVAAKWQITITNGKLDGVVWDIGSPPPSGLRAQGK